MIIIWNDYKNEKYKDQFNDVGHTNKHTMHSLASRKTRNYIFFGCQSKFRLKVFIRSIDMMNVYNAHK